MTSRERFLASLLGGGVDRFFRYEHGPWPSTRERWLAEGYPAAADFARHFGMDPLVRIMINSGYTDSPYQPRLLERRLEETAEFLVYSDSDGITKKVFKSHGDLSMPQFLRFPVAGRDDWQRLLPHLNPADAPARIGDTAALARRCADPAVPTLLPVCGAYGHPRNLFGEEGLAYVVYDDPGLLHEILDNWLALYTALLRTLTRSVRVDSILIWEDMCFRNGPLLSPRHVREFMLPPYRRLIAEARACGVRAVIVDSDGDVRALLPLFLEAGVNALLPFEVQAGMDVVALRAEFGPDFGIVGGLDKRALARGPREIEAEVARVLGRVSRAERFIPTLDHTVPVDVPLASFEYYLACVRRHEPS